MIFEFAYHLRNVVGDYRLCPETGKFFKPSHVLKYLNPKAGQDFRNRYRNKVLTQCIGDPSFTLRFRIISGCLEIQNHRYLNRFPSRSNLLNLFPNRFSIWLDKSRISIVDSLTDSP